MHYCRRSVAASLKGQRLRQRKVPRKIRVSKVTKRRYVKGFASIFIVLTTCRISNQPTRRNVKFQNRERRREQKLTSLLRTLR